MNQNVLSFESGCVTALNYHLWRACNMRCKYCFSGFDECRLHRPNQDEQIEKCFSIIRQSVEAGIRKITFSGGEPLLCPWLHEAVAKSKRLGLTTMIVSNGSLIDEAWLERFSGTLDWLGISVDSLDLSTNQKIGRCRVGYSPFSGEDYASLCHRICTSGIRLKINTVVSAFNWQENFSALLDHVTPERWKVIQAIHIRGQNDLHFNECGIDALKYKAFLQRHSRYDFIVPEDNTALQGSYLMINPEGCFFDDTLGHHRTSLPIWQVGWEEAFSQIRISSDKFKSRGGDWDWKTPRLNHFVHMPASLVTRC